MTAKSRCLHGGRDMRMGVKSGAGPPPGAGHCAQGPGIIGGRAPPGDENRAVRVEGSAPEQKSPCGKRKASKS